MQHNSNYPNGYFSPGAADAFARCLLAVTTEVAAAVLAQRLGSAMGTRGAIVGRADAVAVSDAVDTWLAAGTNGEDGGAA